MSEKIKFVDLFCGIGSFHYSFKKLGWECVMACDIIKNARDIYKLNYGMEALGDIYDIDPKTVKPYDILCAGFPCQPFSQAGKHKGFDDERGTLFYQVMKFVKINEPGVVILENVQGLLNHDGGKTFDKIKGDLKKEKYDLVYKVLNCSEYGIPQMRKRLFVICVKKIKPFIDINKIFEFSKYEKIVTLSDFFNKKFEKKIAYTIRCGGKHSPIDDKHNWDGYMVNGKEYRLSIDDAKLLQGFDNKFQLIGSDADKWKRLGNTIPTIFTKMIGENIKQAIKLDGVKPNTKSTPKIESDQSDNGFDESEDEKPKKIKKKKVIKKNNDTKSRKKIKVVSESEDSLDDESEEEKPKKKVIKNNSNDEKPKKKPRVKPDDSKLKKKAVVSDSDDSFSEPEEEKPKKVNKKKLDDDKPKKKPKVKTDDSKIKNKVVVSESDDSSSDELVEIKPKKKVTKQNNDSDGEKPKKVVKIKI